MRWIVALLFLVVGAFSGFCVLVGAPGHGFDTLWSLRSPESWAPRWDSLWGPSPLEAALWTLAIGGIVFAALFLSSWGGRSLIVSPQSRWGRTLLCALAASTALTGVYVALGVVALERGAPPSASGAAFIAGAAQTAVALALALALCFVPKSRACFASLLVLVSLEASALVGVVLLGTGTPS
jgi:hypothetical protein